MTSSAASSTYCPVELVASAEEPLAAARGTDAADQEARDAALHQRALRGREGMQYVAADAGEGALIAWLELSLERALRVGGRQAGVDRHGRLFVGVQDPVTVRLRQVTPRRVDVVSQCDQDVAQVLAVPGWGPRRDRPLTNRERRVGHHGFLGDLVDAAEPMAGLAGALRRVGREVLRVQHWLLRRVGASARVEHPDQARQRRHAADRRACPWRAALLLQRHRGRQAVDAVDIGRADLLDQAARVGRDRFEEAALRLSVQSAKGERRLARARDPRKHHKGTPRNVEVDVLQVVLARSAHAYERARLLAVGDKGNLRARITGLRHLGKCGGGARG